jgi:hypothetical protein
MIVVVGFGTGCEELMPRNGPGEFVDEFFRHGRLERTGSSGYSGYSGYSGLNRTEWRNNYLHIPYSI